MPIDLQASMERIGMSGNERISVYEVVAACLLIGEIEFGERAGMDMSYIVSRKGHLSF